MKLSKSLLVLLLIIIANISFSQEYLGLRQSNYAGIMGVDLNPASIADSRYKVDIILFNFYGGVYNNHAHFNTRKMPRWWINASNQDDPVANAWMNSSDSEKLVSVDSTAAYKNAGKGQFFEIDNGDKKRSAFLHTDVSLLNFMVSLGRKRAIGFQIKNRTMLNIDDASPELIRLASNEFEFQNLFNISVQDEDINISMNTWNEYNFSYAQILKDGNDHFFKIGGKVKLLQGVASAYLHSTDLNFNIQNDTTANSISGNFDYGYSENLGGYIEPNESLGTAEEFAGGDIMDWASKLGLGLDLGVVYEWRPDWKKYKYDMDGETDLWMQYENKYKLRVGAAINDIGGMKYQKGGLSNNFNLNVGVFDLQKFDDTEGLRSLDSTLTNFADSGWVTFNNSDDREFYMNLPTHLNLDVDYNIYKKFYINAFARINLKYGKDENTVHYPTSVALTPRFDHKRYGVSLPFSYNGVAGFRTGLALRIWYFHIGTGDLKPFFAPKHDRNVRGADIFVGARIPILYKAPKDRDKDKVSDKLDECIDIPGIWALRGCSDVDNDGILDQNDSCVTDSGLVKFNGCPDTDGDGIMDKEDDCPDVAGLLKFNGCPDTDGDGLMDKEDDCPETPGPLENKGCPYKLLHKVNKDGVVLFTDTLTKFEELYRFPFLSKLENHLFQMIEDDESGFVKVIVGQDTIIATRNSNNFFEYKYVAPVLEPETFEIELAAEEEIILKAAFDNLEFETGKAVIKESSFKSLEDLAKLLLKKPIWRLKISGHTDSVGKASNNLRLSKKRAQAVGAFMEANNVNTDRLDVEWFGETKPVESNKTKAGRQKNRRVEMKIE